MYVCMCVCTYDEQHVATVASPSTLEANVV